MLASKAWLVVNFTSFFESFLWVHSFTTSGAFVYLYTNSTSGRRGSSTTSSWCSRWWGRWARWSLFLHKVCYRRCFFGYNRFLRFIILRRRLIVWCFIVWLAFFNIIAALFFSWLFVLSFNAIWSACFTVVFPWELWWSLWGSSCRKVELEPLMLTQVQTFLQVKLLLWFQFAKTLRVVSFNYVSAKLIYWSLSTFGSE